MSAINAQGATKQYGDVTALQDLELTVERGEVFGFLGPNGAGKSTTIDIILDHARPTAGSVQVLGMDAQNESVAIRERTGVLPERFDPLGEMTGREHIEFAVEAKNAEDDPKEILDRVGLVNGIDRPATTYSKGMTQRLMLGVALVGTPELLILDEPTTGLDPNGAREIRKIVTEERDRGTTVFFSSHILEQVEAVCDRVGILNRGRLVAVDTIDGLREATDTIGEITISLTTVPDELQEHLQAIDGTSSARIQDSTLTVTCENHAKGAVIRACHDLGANIENIETNKASLEEIFTTYTGGR